ncbi:uroporphyrinogen-III synthase [Exiguobacterium aurantiacum]|uniref:Uroporphyrinogen-III synthase n=2 Tax=Exiguobacterium aurantiacum TaxID=33987 RepID=A0A377FV94_9BACL|nr:uroporphyrinogen-III synthase [Exiguobacterium aurantiacum]
MWQTTFLVAAGVRFSPRSMCDVWYTGTKRLTASQRATLEASGLSVHHVPLIETRLTDAPLPTRSFDWLVVTSQNAVPALSDVPRDVQVAAVGEKTKQALEAVGFTVSLMPKTYTGEALFHDLAHVVKPGETVLFARGDLANTDHMGQLGHVVDWVVYETVGRELTETEAEALGRVQVLLVLSPSAVHALTPYLERFHGTWYAIGEVTERAVRQVSTLPVRVPECYTMDALIQCVGEDFS